VILGFRREEDSKAVFWSRQDFGLKFLAARPGIFYISLTVHIGIIIVNNQLDALFQCIYLFISLLYMFRATQCSSSGESIVSIHHLVYITLCG
jgi:hypothetical protein